MKIIFLPLLLLSFSQLSFSQSIERQVIATAGSSYDTIAQVDWTIGEAITDYWVMGTQLAQGFQQYSEEMIPPVFLQTTLPPLFDQGSATLATNTPRANPNSINPTEILTETAANEITVTPLPETRQALPSSAEAFTVSVFPNPTTDYLKIKINNPSNSFPSTAQYFIFDAKGQNLFQRKMEGTDQTLNLQDLPAGIYRLQIFISPELYHQQAFVVQR